MPSNPTPATQTLELPSAGKHSSGRSSSRLYKIEVRDTSTQPRVLQAQESVPFVIDGYWRQLPIYRGPTKWGVNIPVRQDIGDGLDIGLVPYAVAEAHRWAFIAAMEALVVGGSLCLETRLVEVELMRTFETKELGVTQGMTVPFKAENVAERVKP